MNGKRLLHICTLFLLSYTLLLAQEGDINLTKEEKEIFASPNVDHGEFDTQGHTGYDIIIIDIGFKQWLNGIAWPKGYYSQSFMENRNQIYVLEWNRRYMEPMQFDPLLYEAPINYDPKIDYGYDVNYQLYNYFIYFQRRYDQRLGPFLPRR